MDERSKERAGVVSEPAKERAVVVEAFAGIVKASDVNLTEHETSTKKMRVNKNEVAKRNTNL